jgi:hypothetical protein
MHMAVSLAAGEMDYTVHLESSLRILKFLQGLAANMAAPAPAPEPVVDESSRRLTRMTSRPRNPTRYSFVYVPWA